MRQKTQQRNTLAKKIRTAPDTHAAIMLALYGRPLAPIEGAMNCFNLARQLGLDKMSNSARAELQQLLMQAVEERNSKPFREIADFIDHPKLDSDETRASLLRIKAALDQDGKKMPINEVAFWMKTPRTDDRYAYLRRLCRALKFPLAKSPTGRPGKTQTNKASK